MLGKTLIYYGSIDQAGWDPTVAVKVLRVGGSLPANTTVMTFVEKGSPLELVAKLGASDIQAVISRGQVVATTEINPHTSMSCKLKSISSFPEVDGKFLAQFVFPENTRRLAVPGIKAKLKAFAEEQKEARVIPADYLTLKPDGTYTVKLKLADGETKEQAVKVLNSYNGEVVISEGLENGQVILK